MDWKNIWTGKRVFVKLRTGAVYTGEVIDVDDNCKPLVFFTLKDKFGDIVTFVQSEIIKLKEERE